MYWVPANSERGLWWMSCLQVSTIFLCEKYNTLRSYINNLSVVSVLCSIVNYPVTLSTHIEINQSLVGLEENMCLVCKYTLKLCRSYIHMQWKMINNTLYRYHQCQQLKYKPKDLSKVPNTGKSYSHHLLSLLPLPHSWMHHPSTRFSIGNVNFSCI